MDSHRKKNEGKRSIAVIRATSFRKKAATAEYSAQILVSVTYRRVVTTVYGQQSSWLAVINGLETPDLYNTICSSRSSETVAPCTILHGLTSQETAIFFMPLHPKHCSSPLYYFVINTHLCYCSGAHISIYYLFIYWSISIFCSGLFKRNISSSHYIVCSKNT